MSKDILTIESFLELSDNFPVIDVRSPAEYQKGHIPGAHNLPLLSDEERAQVGTCFKTNGQGDAVELGSRFAGPKMEHFIRKSKEIAPEGKILIYCWRGGMRSHSFAWLLKTAGFSQVSVLEGGYKAFRKLALESFDQPADLLLIGGMTGSGKTAILNELEGAGQQTIDLEALAGHKGSAFGAIGQPEQCSSEHFQNKVFMQWRKLDLDQTIWLEDESHSIGGARIPDGLYQQMKNARMIAVDLPKALRIERLIREYADQQDLEIKRALLQIEKKLGQHAKEAFQNLEQKNYTKVAELALNYYDKSYHQLMKRRSSTEVYPLPLEEDKPRENADKLITYQQKLFLSEKISTIEKWILA